LKHDFTFLLDQDFELNEEQSTKFLSFFGAKTLSEIEDQIPSSMRPNLAAAKEYGDDPEFEVLDAKLLPNLWLEVFADNFSKPELVFSTTPKIFVEHLIEQKNPDILNVRVEQLSCNSNDEKLSVNVVIEVKVQLDVVDGVNMIYGEEPDENIAAQIYECKNMCNFGFVDMDVENDEGLNHGWEAVPTGST
jgi:hypothetical protein